MSDEKNEKIIVYNQEGIVIEKDSKTGEEVMYGSTDEKGEFIFNKEKNYSIMELKRLFNTPERLEELEKVFKLIINIIK